MNRLLGNPPDQITEEEKEQRIQEIMDAQRELVRPQVDADEKSDRNYLLKVGELEAKIVEIEKKYPDLPPEKPIVVAKVKWFGGACPTQLEGTTEDGKEVYARYRGGRVRVEIGNEVLFSKQLDYGEDDDHSLEYYMKTFGYDEERAKKSVESHELMKLMNGGYVSYRGTLSYQELIEATKGWLEWPKEIGR